MIAPIRRWISVALVFFLGAQATGATAEATIVYHDRTTRDWAVGVNHVVVGETRYNVTFVYGGFLAAFGDPRAPDFQPFPFWDDPSLTEEASWAVAEALNGESPIPLLDPAHPYTNGLVYLIPRGPFSDAYGGAFHFVNACAGSGTWQGTCGAGVASIQSSAPFAKFSAVSEPTTLALFAFGLAGLGLSRRRNVA